MVIVNTDIYNMIKYVKYNRKKNMLLEILDFHFIMFNVLAYLYDDLYDQ